MDSGTKLQVSLKSLVKLFAGVNPDRKMLDPDLVVTVRSPVGLPQSQRLLSDRQICDLLSATVVGEAVRDLDP